MALYLVLLTLSHGVRRLCPQERSVGPEDRVVSVRAVEDDRPTAGFIELVFADHGAAPDAPAILLVHGSPGSKKDFDNLVPGWEGRFRVIVPDLPGFGASTRELPDYSSRAHARYLIQLLDQLGVEQVHLVCFSMGGGAGLLLYDIAPHRVRSMTLLSATGVQELELFGDHGLNRAVHSVQFGALWLAREALPHMGFLDDAMIGVPYARNFLDSDQRPLREVLIRFEPPMLILHGARDFLVSPAVAREHHRLVPQSRLELTDGSHFMVFLEGKEMARRIGEFVDQVEAGRAIRRNQASASRVAAAGKPFDLSEVPPFTGVALALMMLSIAVATLASEDLTCIGVGLLVAQGRIEFLAGVDACFAGILAGDLAIYCAGRFLGDAALDRRPLRWFVRPEVVELCSSWFEHRGPVVIGLSRFLPGTRLPTYLAAGLLRARFWSFLLYFVVAIAVWTPFLVGLSMLLGDRVLHLFESYRHLALPVMILVGLLVLGLVKFVVPLFTFRGRRSLVGSWRRWTRWEFWPPWVFYPPVVLYVVWLMLRHRSPLLFTAANPAMPAGGFIAESKILILRGLAGAGDRVARTELVPVGETVEEKRERIRGFMSRWNLDYPVVLKPDVGQRGSGVAVVRDTAELEAYLEGAQFDLLVQEHVPGHELGIFYYRYPDETRGRIFSITEKRMPVVRGDGTRTLEELILLDRRAVSMARRYLRVQGDRVWRVPREGEEVALVELGTHCRGAIFLDGSRFRTDPLERAIDETSRAYHGFFFGRYDVRTDDLEKLKLGLGFKVIELNGVTSEATHIYDPRFGLFRAYRTLFEQWRIAFEVGRRNQRRGARPAQPEEMLGLLREYRRLARNHPGLRKSSSDGKLVG